MVPEPGFPCIHSTALSRPRRSHNRNFWWLVIQDDVPSKQRLLSHSSLNSWSTSPAPSHLRTSLSCLSCHCFSRSIDAAASFSLHSIAADMSKAAASRSIRSLLRAILSRRLSMSELKRTQRLEKNIFQFVVLIRRGPRGPRYKQLNLTYLVSESMNILWYETP